MKDSVKWLQLCMERNDHTDVIDAAKEDIWPNDQMFMTVLPNKSKESFFEVFSRRLPKRTAEKSEKRLTTEYYAEKEKTKQRKTSYMEMSIDDAVKTASKQSQTLAKETVQTIRTKKNKKQRRRCDLRTQRACQIKPQGFPYGTIYEMPEETSLPG